MKDLFNPVKTIRITVVIIIMMVLIGLFVKLTDNFAITFGIFVLFFGLLLFWDKIDLERTPREKKKEKRKK